MNKVSKRANKVLCILLALTVLSGPLGILVSAADLSLGNREYVNYGKGAVKGSSESLNIVNNPNANYYYYTKANGATHELRMMYVASDGSGTPIYDNNGKVIWAYCIEYGASGSSWIETQATDLTSVDEWRKDLNDDQREGITYATLYGYPSNNFGVSNCDAYAATQAVIWEFQQGCRTLSGGLNNAKFYNDFIKSTPAETAYNALVNEIYNAIKVPSFNGTTADLIYDSQTGLYQTILYDSNRVISNYTVRSFVDGIQTLITGDIILLVSRTQVTTPVTIQLTKKIPCGTSQAMMVMYDENNQAAIIGQSQDPVYAGLYAKTYTGDMKITKTAEDGNVSGIKFTISCGALVYTKTTDSNGIINLSGLPTGKYNVTEESINKYVPQTTQKVTISADTTSTVNFSNVLKKFNVALTKKDSETGQTAQGDATLKGAVYGIYDNGVLVDSYTTNNKGEFTSDYYICGENWTIKEISPSNGYQLDSKEYSIGASASNYVIENNSINLSVMEDCIKGKIAITKHSDDGSTKIETPEAGAQFEVYLKSAGSYDKANDTQRDLMTCDENGYAITKDLPYGTYTVHQIKGAAGHEYISDFDVYVIKNAHVYSYIINNSYFQGYVKVIKKDSGTGKNIAYAGAGFQIYRPDGSLVKMTVTYPAVKELDTFYTDASGELVTPQKLEIGTGYKLVEVQAPYGYVLDKTPVYFDISQENSIKEDGISVIKVTKTDTAQKGVITIEKKGEVFDFVKKYDNIYTPGYKVKGLEGAVYEITAKDDIYTSDGTLRAKQGEVVDTVTTGTDGTVQSKELYLGEYEIKEIKAPYGMVLNDKSQTVKLEYSGQNVEVTEQSVSVINERQKVKICLMKQMEQDNIFKLGMNNEICNVSFGLYAAEDIKAEDGTVIPKDGLIEIIHPDKYGYGNTTTDLPFGSYYIKEISTDKAFLTDDTIYPVKFVYKDSLISVVKINLNYGNEIDNKLIRGQIKGWKISQEGKGIAGAMIGLFKADTEEYTKENALMTAVSSDNGSFSFDNVPYGEYTVKEIEAPKGYVLSNELYSAVIDSNSKVVEINIVNSPEPKTGDSNRIYTYVCIFSVATGGLISTFILRRKRDK